MGVVARATGDGGVVRMMECLQWELGRPNRWYKQMILTVSPSIDSHVSVSDYLMTEGSSLMDDVSTPTA